MSEKLHRHVGILRNNQDAVDGLTRIVSAIRSFIPNMYILPEEDNSVDILFHGSNTSLELNVNRHSKAFTIKIFIPNLDGAHVCVLEQSSNLDADFDCLLSAVTSRLKESNLIALLSP